MNERLLVVSNRLPVTLKKVRDRWRTEDSAGGLVTALRPLVKKSGGLWLGWSGDSSDPHDPARAATLRGWGERYASRAVEIPPEIARDFYEGFANRALWPLFHSFPTKVEFHPEGWKAYQAANRIFHDAVKAEIGTDDLVWIHDYQLMLLPRLLRESTPSATIGFFLHIPFPPSEIFRTLPRREIILEHLLAADLLAFQTHADLQHFRISLLRVLGQESSLDRVERGGHVTRLQALPIGIDPDEFLALVKGNEETAKLRTALTQRFVGQQMMLAVDRIDYTKGIVERFRTFDRILRAKPDLRGRVVLVQVAVPSRGEIPEYQSLRREVNEWVGRLNGEFGTAVWTPVVYLRRPIAREELVALYQQAALMWVTPLRDGMNLVGKEYAVCHPEGDGVLVLSEFAGAASEMGEALLVNPYDEEETAATVVRGLGLGAEERRDRMTALHQRAIRNDVHLWSHRFLQELKETRAVRATRRPGRPALVTEDALARAYRMALRRLLLLDYDGTLVPLRKRPRAAVPPVELHSLLTRLASDPANVVAVVSGRSARELGHWFGATPHLWIAAEHGAMVRDPEAKEWSTSLKSPAAQWWERLHPILGGYVDRLPNSFVEVKEYGLVWHYGMADPIFGEWLANQLATDLDGLLASSDLHTVRGHRSVEVRPIGMHKGLAAAKLLELAPEAEFILACGDDRTDEDLLRAMPPAAWSIHVGSKESAARFSIADPHALRGLLERLAEESTRPHSTVLLPSNEERDSALEAPPL